MREFAEKAYAQRGVTLQWRGEGMSEQGVCAKTGKILVSVDPALFRPLEVDHLRGDAAKARAVLGWAPEISFEGLVAEMVEAEGKSLAISCAA